MATVARIDFKMICPECSYELTEKREHGIMIDIDVCSGCAGEEPRELASAHHRRVR